MNSNLGIWNSGLSNAENLRFSIAIISKSQFRNPKIQIRSFQHSITPILHYSVPIALDELIYHQSGEKTAKFSYYRS
jgi:hypothetical protein